jgi:hypothetical protein
MRVLHKAAGETTPAAFFFTQMNFQMWGTP